MSDAFWAVIGAAIGGLITLAATFFNSWQSRRTAKIEFNRKNFEEIYTMALRIFDLLENGLEGRRPAFPPVYSVSARNEAAENSALYRKQFEESKFRLEMLVNFYSDNLVVATTKYLRECENYFEKKVEIRTSEELEVVKKKFDELKKQKEYYFKAIYAEARKNY
ncbi:hypothetical protein SporoP37_15945 [Sporosarcina sp. P37]|uniref:hypothetical protein n=1 Tax=unclassified Sporosarcina TaxID=2647733 RepID=UPI000A17F9C8|nr:MULTISPECIES: hypothetical protein [unclassified Sporosarcina]ARK26018.1 hypothetical protein SporoP37_15945 [Sporosarcina sp. P37]PID19387.1 hypothetical protein CSV62_02465 [Sporosarcina sp. P35]